MAVRDIRLTDEQEAFVSAQVKSGHYADADEVIRAALETLERAEVEDEMKAKALDEAIAAGFASGVAKGDVFARVRERAGLPPRARR
ncbi:MAG TPA: type II toxin-antitoxin system ParD family antitoxin [Acidobacteriaceae bacterium]